MILQSVRTMKTCTSYGKIRIPILKQYYIPTNAINTSGLVRKTELTALPLGTPQGTHRPAKTKHSPSIHLNSGHLVPLNYFVWGVYNGIQVCRNQVVQGSIQECVGGVPEYTALQAKCVGGMRGYAVIWNATHHAGVYKANVRMQGYGRVLRLCKGEEVGLSMNARIYRSLPLFGFVGRVWRNMRE